MELPPIAIPATLMEQDFDGSIEPGASFHGIYSSAKALTGRFFENMVVEASRFERTGLQAMRCSRLDMRDVEMLQCDLSNSIWDNWSGRRIFASHCRMTGFSAPEGSLKEVCFQGCKLDLAAFRFAKLESVWFRDCVLKSADFSSSLLIQVEFEKCDLSDATFAKCQMTDVDFRSSSIGQIKSVEGLAGAIVDSVQMLDLSNAMAQALGIVLRDPRIESAT